MKIFGVEFVTKKELREQNEYLLEEVKLLKEMNDDLYEEFPFFIGQTVYDVALKNAFTVTFYHNDIGVIARNLHASGIFIAFSRNQKVKCATRFQF